MDGPLKYSNWLNENVVNIKYLGVCHSDLLILKSDLSGSCYLSVSEGYWEWGIILSLTNLKLMITYNYPKFQNVMFFYSWVNWL